MLHNRPLSIVT